MKWFTAFSVFILILTVIGISGCTDYFDYVTMNVFNESGVYFEYPNNWENFTPDEPYNYDKDWVNIFAVSDADSYSSIYLYKNEKRKDSTPEQIVKDDIEAGKVEYLNHTVITVNGIQMSKTIIKFKTPDKKEELMNIDVYFQDKNKVIYDLQFVTIPENFENINKVADGVINSIQMR